MLLTLNLQPGLALGPFFLGMPIGKAVANIQDSKTEHHIVEVKYTHSAESVGCRDIVLNFPEAGMHLRFEPHSQRLRLIEVYDLSRMQVRFAQALVGGASNTATFVRIYDLFGPTFPGELDLQGARYSLHYPGLSFVFPIPRQHAPQLKEAELPLEFPDGTTPVASRIALYSGTVKELAALDTVAPPTLKPGAAYFSKVTALLDHGLSFGSEKEALMFGASPQDVWSVLGTPSSMYPRAAGGMAIQSGGASARSQSSADYFYSYFSRGLDVIFCGRTHRVRKFVLHTNPPGHIEFNTYNKCNFEIPVSSHRPVESPPLSDACGAKADPSVVESVQNWHLEDGERAPASGPTGSPGDDWGAPGDSDEEGDAAGEAPARGPGPAPQAGSGRGSRDAEEGPRARAPAEGMELPTWAPGGDAASGTITCDSSWEEVQSLLGPGGRATINTGGTASNPFGPTYVYGYRGVAFEVMKDGSIARVTLFKA
uniref:Upf0183 protein n=2 Tax=Tetraselmis sp. GSL018 TaxID=582737 RepID=A0A061R1P5_9CHLO|mmetsp:Transcript_34679/g.82236  ORF Transcript_34679/g.82236 Transcript_34679/m.82236 type:complete len:483 (+) Transcript_34679:387-1835(+)